MWCLLNTLWSELYTFELTHLWWSVDFGWNFFKPGQVPCGLAPFLTASLQMVSTEFVQHSNVWEAPAQGMNSVKVSTKLGSFFVGQSWLPKRGFLDQPDHAISCPLPHLESSLQSLWAPHIVMDAGDRRLDFVADPYAWWESLPEIGRLHLGFPVLPCDTPALLAVSLFMHSPTSPSVALVLFQSMSHHVHSFSISFFRFQWGLDSIFALHFVHNWAQNWTFNSCLLLLSFPPPTYN